MNNFKTLFKYNLINSLGINKLKKNKNSSLGIGALVTLIYLGIFAFVTLYMFLFVEMFKEMGNVMDFFLFITFVSSLVCFFITISKADAYLFRTKDYDFLMSLPIKTSAIILTKLLSLYIYNLLIVFTCFATSNIAFFIVNGFDLYIFALSLLGIILIPFIPMVVSSFLSFALGFIPVNQKVKNIIMMVIYIVLFGGLMIVYFLGIDSESGNVINVYLNISRYYIFGKWFYDGITKANITNFLLFIGLSVGLLVLFVLIVSCFFLKINGAMSRNKTKSNYRLNKEKFESSSVSKAILFKELRTLFNAPQVLIQLLGGPIMSLVAVVVLTIMSKNGGTFGELLKNADANSFVLVFSVIICFSLTMVSTTSSTISLEGKSFWIIKSAPVPAKQVIKAKCLVNLLLMLPIAFICIVFVTIFYKSNVFISLLGLLFNVLYVMFSTFLGLLFNLKYYKFDYDNPVKAVKQGKAVLLTMLVDMGGTIIISIMIAISAYFAGPFIGVLSGVAFSSILAFLTLYLLNTKGVKLYEEICC